MFRCSLSLGVPYTLIFYFEQGICTCVVVRCDQGVLCRTLQGHAHWVNTLALSTDYVMRTGAFDPANAKLVKDDVTDTCE